MHHPAGKAAYAPGTHVTCGLLALTKLYYSCEITQESQLCCKTATSEQGKAKLFSFTKIFVQFQTIYLYSQHYIFVFVFNGTHFLSTSTKITFIQQKQFSNFNQNYFYSTKIIVQLQPKKIFFSTPIFVQLQPKIISFNKNIRSTSTKIIFIQQKYLFNFNQNYFHSTKIIIIRCTNFSFLFIGREPTT